MPGVTISAGYGAGGSVIAPEVARQLGLPMLDRAISSHVAAQLRVSVQEAEGGVIKRSGAGRFLAVLAPLAMLCVYMLVFTNVVTVPASSGASTGRRALSMFVGLIIFCAVVHGIATVREAKKVGRVAIKALIYFEVVTTFALVIGLAMINLLGPGRGMHVDLQSISGSALDPYLKTAQQITGSGFLLSIVPHTAISALMWGCGS